MKRYKDFMEGYVPSADKKPAADGRMLPARKIKTNKPDPNKETKPTQGGLGEKMDMKKADMGDVIKDFQDSDAPQFKGKSKEKRREMAIAAKLSAEETDLEENYLNKDGTGRSKEGYHDAGMFDKATADKHAKTHNGTVHQDASGKHLVKLPKPKQEETAE